MTTRKGYRECSRCKRSRAERFFKPRGRICASCRKGVAERNRRNSYLLETYGITIDEYDAMREAQGDACAICGRQPAYNLQVDHDHAIEKALIAEGCPPLTARRRSVRGLLCKSDNKRLLPAARDDVDTLKCAINYLENWPANGVLRPSVAQLSGEAQERFHRGEHHNDIEWFRAKRDEELLGAE